MKDFRLLVLLIFLCSITHAQSDTALAKESRGKTLKRLGKNALKQNDPQSAITFFESYLKNSPKDAEALALLGHAHMRMRDYDRAESTFLRAYKSNKEKAGEALYYHALMQKSNGKYDSAKVNFQKFKKEYKGKKKDLKKLATREIVFCDSVQMLIGMKHKTIIQLLDTGINKVNIEAAPSNINGEQMVFTSLRTEKIEYIIEDDTAKAIKRKLYVANRKDDKWQFAGEFGTHFNESEAHTGNACFSPDRQRVYFTRCKLNYLEKMTCAIYVSEKDGDGWKEPVKLPKTVNNPKYTFTMPAVTKDPKKGNDIIYFVSDKKGGKGKLDIWYTTYNIKTKTYSVPKNAGSKVNTAQDEITPFFDMETMTLYFSSNGLGGLGGFDIFKTKGDGKKWIGVTNIGQPLNTGADDIYYTISTNREEGFFVSNRKGGNSLKNSTCCDDIYYYKLSEYVRLVLQGTISEEEYPHNTIANALVDIYVVDKVTKQKVLVKTVTTDSEGRYKTSVEPDQEYEVVARKDEYLNSSDYLDTKNFTVSKNFTKDLNLPKKPRTPLRIPNVSYQYDRWEIDEGSKIRIDSTVYKLMIKNPLLIVEIMAHTDAKGTDSYNQKLSQKRAESVVQYLLSKGIHRERLTAKGYGESQPIAPNTNPDGSDNPAGREKNRRTDFRVIGLLEEELINEADR